MNIYPGEVVDVEGTTPGPAPTYIVRYAHPTGSKTLRDVRPSYWSWDSLGVDEDGAKTVADHTGVIVFEATGSQRSFLFVPAPLVGQCTGPESALIPALLDRIGQLELRLAKLEAAP